MTDTEIDILTNTIKALWPRIAKGAYAWSSAEWSVLDEFAARIDINADQAVAAVRAAKAGSDKYPTTRMMLDALKRAENKPVRGPASELPPPSSRLSDMRKRLMCANIATEGKSPAEIVVSYWRDACVRSMRMRGDILPSYEQDFHADAAEIGRMTDHERAEWWACLMDEMQSVELDPDLAEHAAANGRLSPERAAELLGIDWNGRPRKVARHKRLADIRKAVEIAQAKFAEGAA